VNLSFLVRVRCFLIRVRTSMCFLYSVLKDNLLSFCNNASICNYIILVIFVYLAFIYLFILLLIFMNNN
jgi:hypothetical protein